MRRIILGAFLVLLTFTGAAAAQPVDPVAAIRGWYVEYLQREPEPAGLQYWRNKLDRGYSLRRVQAGILSSDEFWEMAGATPQTYVQTLFRVVLRRDPSYDELLRWSRRAARWDRTDVALDFLAQYRPAPVLPPVEAVPRYLPRPPWRSWH